MLPRERIRTASETGHLNFNVDDIYRDFSECLADDGINIVSYVKGFLSSQAIFNAHGQIFEWAKTGTFSQLDILRSKCRQGPNADAYLTVQSTLEYEKDLPTFLEEHSASNALVVLHRGLKVGRNAVKDILSMNMDDKIGPAWQRAYLRYQAKHHTLHKRTGIFNAFSLAPKKRDFFEKLVGPDAAAQEHLAERMTEMVAVVGTINERTAKIFSKFEQIVPKIEDTEEDIYKLLKEE